jgi:hypothetical protein
MIDPKLLEYCTTERQREAIQAVIDIGIIDRAAAKVGMDKSGLRRVIRNLKGKAARAGYAPDHGMTHEAAPSFAIKKVSTMYGDDGEIKLQWVQSSPEAEQMQEAVSCYIEGLISEQQARKPVKVSENIKHDPELLTKIYIGDAHIGAYCYAKETKHTDYDSDNAVSMHEKALDYLIDRAEHTETGVIVDVGDYMHANGQSETTFKGTKVDVDTRHSAVMFKAAMLMRYAIEKALLKFKKVIVVIARGNHNDDSAIAIQLAISFYYENEPRVTVPPNHGYYHYMEYGKWLFGTTHGDKQKPASLAANMARDMPEAWGRTTHRLWETGHFHIEQVKTYPGVKVKTFAAITPPDGWHASMGYGGDGEMEMITFRKSGGIHSSLMYDVPQPRTEPDVKI